MEVQIQSDFKINKIYLKQKFKTTLQYKFLNLNKFRKSQF